MKDTARIWYQVLAINEETGQQQSLGIGRDFQVMITRDLALAKLTPEQREEGWTVTIKERKDLGVVPGTRPTPRGRSNRRRNRRS